MKFANLSRFCANKTLLQDTTLRKMIDLNLEPYLEKFEGISEAATKEFGLEKAMAKMVEEWTDVSLLDHLEISMPQVISC